jgi:hypothetical protein
MTTSTPNTRSRICFLAVLVVLAMCLPAALQAETPVDVISKEEIEQQGVTSIADILRNGTINANMRLRYEGVDQDGKPENANALTGRLRMGYTTGTIRGFHGLVELEAITDIGDDRYDSTQNGRDQFPVVADPEDAEFNQAYLGWAGGADLSVKLGRQRIIMNNARVIGNVGFRQNEQTFDAITFKAKPHGKLDLTGGFIDNANRIFGEHNPTPARANTDLNMIYLNLTHACSAGNFSLYYTGIENEDNPLVSHRNIGLRFSGGHDINSKAKLLYTAEYIDQSDYADAPSSVDAEYILGEVGLTAKKVTYKVGYEMLGGDGVYGFATPLATGHAFNGWTDKFLSTPATGIDDLYVSVSGKIKGWKVLGAFHDFSANEGDLDHGSETGVLIAKKFAKGLYGVSAKYAMYDADNHATDTSKLWVALDINLKRKIK